MLAMKLIIYKKLDFNLDQEILLEDIMFALEKDHSTNIWHIQTLKELQLKILNFFQF